MNFNKNGKFSDYYDIYKIIIIGSSNVGKTSLALRFTKDDYKSNISSTIGMDFFSKTIIIKNNKINVQIWDTAGQEKFRTITTSYYRNTHGILLCFSLDNQQSFDDLQFFLKSIRKHCYDKIPIILVGNKSDGINIINKNKIGEFMSENNISRYYEISCKKNKNITELFSDLFIEIYSNKYNEQKSPKIDINKKNYNKKNCC